MITLYKTYFKGNALIAVLSAGFICVSLTLSVLAHTWASPDRTAVTPLSFTTDSAAATAAASGKTEQLGEQVLDGIRFNRQLIPVANTEPPVAPAQMPQTTVYGMGASSSGQLGNGSISNAGSPQQVGPAGQWGGLIAVGLQHSLIVDNTGGLWASGSDATGAFGDGAIESTTNQFSELSIFDIKSIAAGDKHSLIVTDQGQVLGSGDGNVGQLGNDGTSSNAFISIMGNGHKVAAFGNNSFVITTSGELWVFGENQAGQLGVGDTASRTAPVRIVTGGVVDVSTSATHTLYLMDDGSAFAMGNNANGQFGDGTTAGSLTPKKVFSAGVKQIAAGEGFSLFRMDDGVLQGVGLNNFGQLGTGDTNVRTTLITIDTNVVDMAAGIGHTVYLKNDRTLWTIGKNESGQLGLGDFSVRLTATQVTTVGQVAGVTAGYDNTYYFARTLDSMSITGLWEIIEGNKVNLECYAHWSDGQTTNVTTEATWTDDAAFAAVMQNAGVVSADPGSSGGYINITASYLGSQAFHSLSVKSPDAGAVLFGHGANSAGQLGTGTTTDQLSEVLIDSNKAISMAGGLKHSIYVRPDGSVWVMGDNTYGQLGTGDFAQRTTPTQILAGGAAEVGAGDYHTLIAMRDGSLWVMGRNNEGQLGDGTFVNRNVPTKIVHSAVRKGEGGAAHSAFVKDDGSLWVMGRGLEGQLGNGDGTSTNVPIQVASNINNFKVGKNHTVYVDQSTGLWGMGDNSVGQLGIGTAPTNEFSPKSLVVSGVNEIGVGADTTFYITTAGDLYCAGNNDFGQLGNGNPGVNVVTFTKLNGYSNIDVVAAGADFALFIDQTGKMFGMGNYANGQLGLGVTGSTSTPVLMPHTGVNNGGFGSQHLLFTKAQPTQIHIFGLNEVYEGEEAQYKCFVEYDNGFREDVSATTTWGVNNANTTIDSVGRLFINTGTDGQQVTVTAEYGAFSNSITANIVKFATNFGQLRGLGANDNYQLGDNLDTTAHLTPITVDTDVVSVSSGYYFTLYVKKDGSLWATGDNTYGQLGTGDFNPRQSPVMVVAADVIDVDCGPNFTMFVKNDGSLWGMGDLTDGKIGNDLYAGQLETPVMVKEAGVVDVECGYNHTLFMCADGSLWGMGANYNGQLGLSTSQYSAVGIPENIIPDGVEKIATGFNHSLYIRYGALYGMGFNSSGQLGIGSTSSIVEVPVQIVASGIRDVSACADFSLFVRNDNTLMGMGNNSTGQLGQGHTTLRISPVVIENSVKDISAGNNFSLWTTQSNVLRACGANDYGQLGIGIISGSELNPVTTDSGPAYQPGAGGYQTFFLIPSLVGIQISGPATVNELDVIPYTATANYSDSSTADVSTTASWGIDTGGSFAVNVLSTADVAGNTPATITATYSGKTDTYNITIIDAATPTVTLSVDQPNISELSGVATLTATLSSTVAQDVIVDLSYTGIAVQGTDFNAPATITIPANNLSASATLNAIDDSLYEGDENVVIDINTVTNADEAGTQQVFVTITDNDPQPTVTLTVSNTLISENGGASNITVTLSSSSFQNVTVDLGYTGTATIGNDFNAPVTLTIPAGNTSASAALNSVNDVINEGNEAIVIDIINVVNATESGTQQRTVTITDDDPMPSVTLSVDQTFISEISGMSTITATLSGETTQSVTVSLGYTGSAVLNTDFSAAPSITIPAGNTFGTALLSAIDDSINEGDEVAVIDITSVTNATENGTQQQTVTITDNDPVPSVTLAVSPASIAELSGVANITATLSNETTQDVTVNLAYGGSAILGTDFNAPGSITIFANTLTASAALNTVDDAANEGDEDVIVDIVGVINGTENGTQQASVIITDDDPIPDVTLTVSNSLISETGGVSNITATLSTTTFQDVTVNLGYTGTASLGTDFSAPATLTIQAGTLSATAGLNAANDAVNEGDEDVIIDITGVINATENGVQQQIVTITDDDPVPTVTLSVDQTTISELSGVSTITATLSGTTFQDVTVNLSYTGSALLVDDFNAPTSITISAGTLTNSVTLNTVDDAIYEGNETAIIDIIGVINATESGTQQRTVTITDNDPVPTVDLTVNLSSITEVSGVAIVTATLSGESTQNITVDLGYTGTATKGTDYNAPASITIFAGNLSASATINALDDTTFEGDEDVIVDITNVINGTENGTQQQTVIITDDETLPTVSLSVNAPTIGEAGGWTFYTLTLSGPSSQIVNVELGYTGAATFGTDYTSPVFFNIPAGTTSFTGTITASDDAVYEGNETVVADIVNVTNAVENGVQQQTITIIDNETIPTVDLTVDLPSISELSGAATVTATLSGTSTQDITVDLGFGGTAIFNTDYSVPTLLTIFAGTTSRNVTLSAINDAVSEGDESIVIDIINVTNGLENGTQQQTITITDDDPTPTVTLTVDQPSIGELSGLATLTATLSNPTNQDVTVDLGYTGTALPGTDYSSPAFITITAGTTVGTASFTANDDVLSEGDETVVIDIINVTNALESGTQQVSVTIVDNEGTSLVDITIDSPAITELNASATITATLGLANALDVTVDLGYTGTATSGADYTSNLSITIPAGNLSATTVLNTVDDLVYEGDETVVIDVINVVNALENGTQQAFLTILENDAVPTVDLTVDLPSIGELSGIATLTATLSGETTQPVTVDLGYTGTALLGTDYNAPASITIPAGTFSSSLALNTIDDTVFEGDETAIIDITTVTNANENGTQQQTVIITDDESQPTVDLTVDLPSIGELSGVATLTATLSGPTTQNVTVDFGYTGTATISSDYNAPASVTIPAGTTTKTTTITTIDDAISEGDETIVIDITTVTNATENGTQQQTVTITDDEGTAVVSLSVDLPTIAEPSGVATLTATLSSAVGSDVTVNLGYTGTATETTDYSADPSITILAGNTTGTATVTLVNDFEYEPDETIIVDITSVVNAVENGTQQKTITISDDETMPVVTLTVDQTSIGELGGSATITATLSGLTSQNVTVDFGYTGLAELGTDYTAAGSMLITAGNTANIITLNTIDDTVYESDETVVIDITNVTNALESGVQQQTVTITDDETVPLVDLTVDFATIGELSGGATLTATLSGTTDVDVTVNLGYSSTAVLGTDFTAPASITIPSGSSSGTAVIASIDDAIYEGDETIIVDISTVTNANENGVQTLLVTITDDEAIPTVDLTASPLSIGEVSGISTLTATLSGPTTQIVTVDLGYTGSATLSTDYNAPASITIPAGNTTGTATISALDDAVNEGDEDVIVDITTVTNANENGTQQQVVIITDNDPTPTVTLTVDLPSIGEASGVATLTATLSGATTQDVVVSLGYTGAAALGTDYNAPASITVTAGTTTNSATLNSLDDVISEGNENAIIDITGVTNAIESGTQQVTVTIVDDEGTPTVDLTVDLPSINEFSGVATLTATLSTAAAQNVTVNLGYTGTATAGTDYTPAGSITVLAGSTTGTASLGTIDDTVYEGDETVVVDIISITNALENGTQQVTVTITDDETIPTVDLTIDLPSIGELSGVATVTATLSGTTTQAVTIDLGYTGAATLGTDYNAQASITITAGGTTGTATINALDDALYEGDEAVVVDITTVTNALENGTQQVSTSIIDDETIPTVDLTLDLPSISEVSGVATITATLSGLTTQDVTVDLGYTGTATLGTDYNSPASITIFAGTTTGSVLLNAVDDAVNESDEAVVIDITTVTNANENGVQQQTVTIADDDPIPTLTLAVDLPSIGELTGAATLTATLSGPTTQDVVVSLGYTGTATFGTDYTAPASITITAGTTVGNVTLNSLDDVISEGDETTVIDVTGVTNAVESGTQQVTVTIVDDEGTPVVDLTVDLPSIGELSGVATLTATLNTAAAQDVTVNLGYTGTATAGTDYTPAGSITILAGNTTGTASLGTIDDTIYEGDEAVVIDIVNVTNALENGTQQVTVTIVEDEAIPTVSLLPSPTSISEFNGVSTLTATLSGVTSQNVTVDLGYTGTATLGTDFNSPASITILAGTTTGTASLTAIDDSVYEGDETALIDIINVINALENGVQQATVGIVEDDLIPTVDLTVDSPSISEAGGIATLTATLSGLTTLDVTVNLGYTGTATDTVDYTSTASITILAGNISGTAAINALDDTVNEGDETVVVDITTITNANENGTQQQTVTITDDDPIPTVTLTVDLTSIGEAGGIATLTATLSGPTTQDVTVGLGATGTATSTLDYTLPASITVLAGATTGTAVLTAIDDVISETDESVIIDIISVTNAVESGTQQQTVTIVDDEVGPTVVSIAITGPLSVFEGTTTAYTATATWSDASTSDVTNLATWAVDTGGTFTLNSLVAGVVAADTPAIITADYGGQSGVLNITITDIVVTSVQIQGPALVAESDSAVYSCIATYNDASTANVTGTTVFSIVGNGVFTGNSLTTDPVLSDVSATITAVYGAFSDTKIITVFNVPGTLTGIRVLGPDTVDENTTVNFQCIADFSDGTFVNVTDAAAWTQTSPYGSIDTNTGALTATEVIGDWPTLVSASYNSFSDSKPAKILDLDPMAMIYVNKNVIGGVNNGTSWTDAFKELRDAFPKAGTGTKIWVAAGTYTPYDGFNRLRTFSMTNNMLLYGGFNGTETLASQRDPVANVTILSGDIGQPGVQQDNSYHVVVGAEGATIDGFTIRDGRAYYTPIASLAPDSPETEGTEFGVDIQKDDLVERQPEFVPSHFNFNDVGAGIVNDSVTMTIRNCNFINNASVYGGGAVYNQANSTVIEDCNFVNNRAERWGGAIFNTDNAVPTIRRSTFSSNRANASGGVMMNSAGASPSVSYCQFRQNYAGRDGGAIINNFSNASFVNCVFWDNSAFDHAGAVINNDSSPQFRHCTFARNRANNTGGAFESNNSNVTVINTIVWGNQATQFQTFNPRWGSNLSLSHCVVDTPSLTGTNLVYTDPFFTDMVNGDLTLQSSSSAINTGINIGITDDINQNGRTGVPDIGAYEFNGVPTPPPGGGGPGVVTPTSGSSSGGGGCSLGMSAPASLLPLIMLLIGMLGIRNRRRK